MEDERPGLINEQQSSADPIPPVLLEDAAAEAVQRIARLARDRAITKHM
jgi:hypothetical protein